MTNRILKAFCAAWLGVSLAACGSSAEVSGEAGRTESKDGDIRAALARFKDARVVGSEAGVPYAITGRLGRLSPSGGVGELRMRDDVREAMTALAPVFRVRSEELLLRRSHQDERGHRHLRFQQMLHGLQVVGGELVVHADETGAIYAINGSARAGDEVAWEGQVGPEAAPVAAVNGSSLLHATAEGTARRVFLLPEHGLTPRPAYEVRVTGEREGMPAEDLVYVDARHGGVLRINPRVHSALGRRVSSANNTTTTPGTLKRSEGQALANDAHVDTNYELLGTTYNCYKTLFNRDSYDNAGALLKSTVHYGKKYVNAFWDGYQMVYGDGDGINSTMLGLDLDVTVHELTHAVTGAESDLIYSGESGGLNESVSDIFAAVCESWTRNWALDADVFKVAEDIWTPGIAGDALRYLDDPAKDGASLDSYANYYDGVDVHLSSGISNLAFALLAKGGTHPRGKTSNRVTGIGTEKAGRIFYKANTDLFTSNTSFEQAKTYTVQAAEALYGVGSSEATAVTEAWKAVGVPQPPPPSSPLTNGVAVTGLSGSAGTTRYYTLEVPAGQGRLTFDMRGGNSWDDADLYVRRGAAPTGSSFDCRPYTSTSDESCVFVNPVAGTWYVAVDAFSGYSGLSLKGSYTATGGGSSGSATVTGSLAEGQQANHGPYRVLPGSIFSVVMTGTGDPDLYVRFGAPATTTYFQCISWNFGASERCEVQVPADQTDAYILVDARSAATYRMDVTYTKP